MTVTLLATYVKNYRNKIRKYPTKNDNYVRNITTHNRFSTLFTDVWEFCQYAKALVNFL